MHIVSNLRLGITNLSEDIRYSQMLGLLLALREDCVQLRHHLTACHIRLMGTDITVKTIAHDLSQNAN